MLAQHDLLLSPACGAESTRSLHESGISVADQETNHPWRHGTCASTETRGAHITYIGLHTIEAAVELEIVMRLPNVGSLCGSPRPIAQHGRTTRVLRLFFMGGRRPNLAANECIESTSERGVAVCSCRLFSSAAGEVLYILRPMRWRSLPTPVVPPQ